VLVGGTHVGPVTDMKRNLRNMFTWIGVPVVIVGALGLLTAFLIEGRLNQQTFAIACVIVMVLAVVTWTVLLKRSNQPAGSSSPPNVSKKKGLQVALLLLFLALVFWLTRGGPWIPRLIGASMLILFITGTVLRKAS
jgi:cobalamin synthase